MPEIEELGIEREDNLPRILEKATERRGLFLLQAGNSKGEVVQAIYSLSAEICGLEKLLTRLLPMLER